MYRGPRLSGPRFLTGAERKGPQTEKHGLRYPPSTGRTVTGGCVDEAAEILEVAPVTVMRDWTDLRVGGPRYPLRGKA